MGVNLPSHQFGQLDRVLVIASPINDVNFHAWNLNRVICFIVLEAGIQMELCRECMGHRKNTVTFLLSPEFLGDCMNFLLKEIRIADEPVHVIPNGPLVYKVPHDCNKVNRRTRSPHAPPRFDSPLYADTNKTFNTTEAPIPPPRPPRPDFIGRRAPVLPPRGIRLSTYLKATSTVSGSCIQSSRDEDNLSCTIGELGNDPNQRNGFVDPNNPPPIPVKTKKSFVLSSDSTPPTNRSPSPSLCTDDITNADFECITKLKFI